MSSTVNSKCQLISIEQRDLYGGTAKRQGIYFRSTGIKKLSQRLSTAIIPESCLSCQRSDANLNSVMGSTVVQFTRVKTQ